MDVNSFDLATNDPVVEQIPDLPAGDPPPAWQMVENGRYRPRRIRGSCIGRELG